MLQYGKPAWSQNAQLHNPSILQAKWLEMSFAEAI